MLQVAGRQSPARPNRLYRFAHHYPVHDNRRTNPKILGCELLFRGHICHQLILSTLKLNLLALLKIGKRHQGIVPSIEPQNPTLHESPSKIDLLCIAQFE
jgi:hypothetical protein